MIIHFKYLKKIIVFIGLFSSQWVWAGAYEDFFSAIKRDDANAVQSLLQRGFDPNTRDPKNFHGLFIALREPSPKVAQILIKAPKIDLNPITADGETPLMMAVFRGQTELAIAMIDKGADVNKPGWAPLHYAATAGNVQLIKILLENHAYIDAESPNKTTPLMMAAHYGTSGAVKLLLEEGADVSLKNELGLTAIDFAQQAKKQDSVDVIAAFIRAQQPKGKW
ncbi:ankyrin repeat domain-containing protein [Variovorax sp. PCZ-1]|uniref:ankyrin repeat domain-containing protein n=1 Tax=Variovorax sp. PCZ-1 TaxID=2835533 RepID=UPI001BCF210B|nr:ankyrin repeat domain-containing protein [Variovorax sp. PCZ-1]MBS7807371.1 ankyrin repeat domain-containing protein [Variovorax sp. PCZ-1]